MSKTQLKELEEDKLSWTFHKCMTDILVKMAGGFTVGAVSSILFFKRKKWPMVLASGFGLGLSYDNCQSETTKYLFPSNECTHSDS